MSAPRSKTVATWVAVLGGTLGLHRLYLHGARDPWAWAPWPFALAGLVGALRMHNLGQDDMLSWALIPLLGIAISVGMFSAIVIGLTPDERWQQRFGAGQPAGWGAVLGVIVALMVGGAVLMGTVAFGGQKFFEWQQSAAAA
jgi:hypothetical protein